MQEIEHKYKLSFKNLGVGELRDLLQQKVKDLKYSKVLDPYIQLGLFELAFRSPKRSEGVFHPSDFCKHICKRKMYFQYTKAEKDLAYVPFTHNNKMQRLVDLGSMIHFYIQMNWKKAGVLIELEPVIVNKKLGISGHADAKLIVNGEVVTGEIKSMTTFKFKTLEKPEKVHINQASVYARELGTKRILFCYYDKNNSDIKEFIVDRDDVFLAKFDVAAKAVISLVKKNKFKKQNNKPDRSCSNRFHERASECPYAQRCWDLGE